MKPAVLLLSGLSAMLAGAFIRSCQPEIPGELLAAWCGPAPGGAAMHAHCAGCIVMLAGFLAVLTGGLLVAGPAGRRALK